MSLANGGTQTVKRSPNDIRVKEASPDVINNLLASLSSLSLPADSDSYSPLIPDHHTSLRPAPLSIKSNSSGRAPPPTSVFSREPPATSTLHEEIPSLDERSAAGSAPSIGEVSVTHVADAPTIKTSRSPSGYSKLTAPKQPSKRRTSQSLRSSLSGSPNSTAPPSRQRQEPTLPQLPEESATASKTSKAKKSSDEARRARALTARGQRDSLQVTKSREAKGKQRAGPESPVSPLYSPLQPPPRDLHVRSPVARSRSPPSNRLFLSEHVSPAARSPIRAPKGQDDINTHRKTHRALRPEPSNDNFVIVHDKKGQQFDRRKVIPSRSSSVGRTSASPPKFGRSSRRSSRRSSVRSQHPSPETVREEENEDGQAGPGEQEPTTVAGPSKPETEDAELEAETSVLRRIRELRAAKEEREKKEKKRSHSLISNPNQLGPTAGPRTTSLAKQKPPDTLTAVKQIKEATTLQEHEIALTTNVTTSLRPPPRLDSASLSPTRASFSRPRPTGIDGRPLSPRPASPPKPSAQGKNVQPTKETTLSRSASRIQRWSNPDLLAAAKSSYQRHTRTDSSKTEKLPATQSPILDDKQLEEDRPSADMVRGAVEEFLASPRLSQRISPPADTRTISFSEVGDPSGHAVFCCVGMGLTRYVMAFYEELAINLKLRLITIERPGIGDSSPYSETRAPLYWPDDVRVVCNHLSIQSFSLIAHSAGAIYALATALKMPSRVRGRMHLLAPWIPPSQLSAQSKLDSPAGSPARAQALPRSQRFLRYVPTPFLRLGSASYGAGRMTGTSTPRKSSQVNSASPSVMTSPRPSMSAAKAFNNATSFLAVPLTTRSSLEQKSTKFSGSPHLENLVAIPSDHNLAAAVLSAGQDAVSTPTKTAPTPSSKKPEESLAWQRRFDEQLTSSIWELATHNANPAVDLLVCLERSGPIGFRYRDVAREVVIRHGSKDSRVPLENVKWLGMQVLQKAEIRVLEGEGHGLMANAGVMASVLAEVSKEAAMGESYGMLGSNSTYNSPELETEASTF
ncbi:MAG: hypothetical protein Q9159_003872 [Coniocarpon cinnabarinum]